MNKEYTIIESNEDLTKIEEYQMILSPAIRSFKDMSGKRIKIEKWCLYTTGDTTILSIKGEDGTVVSGQSLMLRETLQTIMELLEKKENFEIEIIVETSKRGRKFCNIALTDACEGE